MRALLTDAFRAALAAADPRRATAPHLPGRPPGLILAVGKAALPMLAAARAAFPDAPYLATPTEATDPAAWADLDPARVLPGGHPLPTDGSARAAAAALSAVACLGPDDDLLVLVSGGGSAAWGAPAGDLTVADLRDATRRLLRAGADIHEANAVRKHLSRVAGGRLAAAAPGRVLALLLSDVPGDDPATIASGPTVPDPTTYAGALDVARRYGLPEDGPVVAHLRRGVRGELDETPKPDAGLGARSETRIVASNRRALEAVRDVLAAAGVPGAILSDRMEGEARDLARFHAQLARSVRDHGTPFAPPVALLSGGEATVTVRGDGVGGRNLEFALAVACELREAGVWTLSAGTDGVDGGSDAAGAIVPPTAWREAATRGVDLRAALDANDSGTALASLGYALVTGPTGTNVGDVRALVIA